MAAKKPGMTVDEHVATAEKLNRIRRDLHQLVMGFINKFPVNHPVAIAGSNTLLGPRANPLAKLQNALDNDYHKVASNEDFDKHGNVYYDAPNDFESVETLGALFSAILDLEAYAATEDLSLTALGRSQCYKYGFMFGRLLGQINALDPIFAQLGENNPLSEDLDVAWNKLHELPLPDAYVACFGLNQE